MARIRQPVVGQFNFEGDVFGLDKLVTKPEILEDTGLKVIHLVISEDDEKVKGFVDEAIKQARLLSPEVKSKGKPIYLTSQWITKKRMKKAGVL